MSRTKSATKPTKAATRIRPSRRTKSTSNACFNTRKCGGGAS